MTDQFTQIYLLTTGNPACGRTSAKEANSHHYRLHFPVSRDCPRMDSRSTAPTNSKEPVPRCSSGSGISPVEPPPRSSPSSASTWPSLWHCLRGSFWLSTAMPDTPESGGRRRPTSTLHLKTGRPNSRIALRISTRSVGKALRPSSPCTTNGERSQPDAVLPTHPKNPPTKASASKSNCGATIGSRRPSGWMTGRASPSTAWISHTATASSGSCCLNSITLAKTLT